jgi:hypothetical protein
MSCRSPKLGSKVYFTTETHEYLKHERVDLFAHFRSTHGTTTFQIQQQVQQGKATFRSVVNDAIIIANLWTILFTFINDLKIVLD